MSAPKNIPFDLLSIDDERRSSLRLPLQIPLFIRSRDSRGDQTLELGKSLDISAGGSLLVCARSFDPGDMVTLTIPAPNLSSSGLIPNGSAPLPARVIRQEEVGDVFLIAVEFLKPLA